MKKLIVMTADLDIEKTVQGLLTRNKSLGFSEMSLNEDVCFVRHPHRDPGCYLHAAEFLRFALGKYQHALVMFDREGCGNESAEASSIAAKVERDLSYSGWKSSAAIVLDPEIESWVWSLSPYVDEELGWKGTVPPLRQWLKDKGFLDDKINKPHRPKEALEAALREKKKPRSPQIYLNLAKRVSLSRCTDVSFNKFKQTMAAWFSQA